MKIGLQEKKYLCATDFTVGLMIVRHCRLFQKLKAFPCVEGILGAALNPKFVQREALV